MRLYSVDYERGLKEGKLLGLKCQDCGAVTCPPMAACRKCGSRRLEAVELSGRGELMTFTVIRVPPEGMEGPYIVCLVRTEEGPWVMGRLEAEGEAEQEWLGRRVRLSGAYVWSDKYSSGERVSPVFRLEGGR
ncbi:MAG: Zn-ribbon domain-containing OB-fold protein [Candidatus Hadarchaeales archaeon]